MLFVLHPLKLLSLSLSLSLSCLLSCLLSYTLSNHCKSSALCPLCCTAHVIANQLVYTLLSNLTPPVLLLLKAEQKSAPLPLSSELLNST